MNTHTKQNHKTYRIKQAEILIIIVLGMLAGSCEKNNSAHPEKEAFDTIRPLSYFPAFPGSWWIYNNHDTLKVAPGYEKYIFNSAGYTAVPDYDTLVLPKLILNGIYNDNDSFAYVKEYSISQSPGLYRDPPFRELLSLTEGAEFTIGGAVQGHKITGKTVKVDTSIWIGETVYNEVIVTIQFDYACTYGSGQTPGDCATLREYYANNVGLVKREERMYPTDAVFNTTLELTDYYIKEK